MARLAKEAKDTEAAKCEEVSQQQQKNTAEAEKKDADHAIISAQNRVLEE